MKNFELTSTFLTNVRALTVVVALAAFVFPTIAHADPAETSAPDTSKPLECAPASHDSHYAHGKKGRRHGVSIGTSAAPGEPASGTAPMPEPVRGPACDSSIEKKQAEKTSCAAVQSASCDKTRLHGRHYSGGKKGRRHGVPAFGTKGEHTPCGERVPPACEAASSSRSVDGEPSSDSQ